MECVFAHKEDPGFSINTGIYFNVQEELIKILTVMDFAFRNVTKPIFTV